MTILGTNERMKCSQANESSRDTDLKEGESLTEKERGSKNKAKPNANGYVFSAHIFSALRIFHLKMFALASKCCVMSGIFANMPMYWLFTLTCVYAICT